MTDQMGDIYRGDETTGPLDPIEIPWGISEGIASWQRILSTARPENRLNAFSGAAIELFRAGAKATRPAVRQAIVDALHDMAELADIDPDDEQQILAEARAEATRPIAEGPRSTVDDWDRGSLNGAAVHEAPHTAAEVSRLSFIDPSAWEGAQVPVRRWLVPHRIPMAAVTMLNGDGAAGKTTIALQLAVATRRGADWLGAVIDAPGPVLFMSAEEDVDEVHRRLAAITEHHGIGFDELAGIHLLCMPEADAVLGGADRNGLIVPTPLFHALRRSATEICPSLIVIEAAADVFAGNENDRGQVRQFIGLLRRLAIGTGAAVLLIAHPSLSGMASGTGTSGSTGWNNSVRSRLYFTSARARDEDDEQTDVRELRVMKSNYGPAGEVMRLRWQQGVFVPEGCAPSIDRAAGEATIESIFLRCLDVKAGQGIAVSHQPCPTYAPRVFESMAEANGIKAKRLALALERLLSSGRIVVETTGPKSKRRSSIVRAGH